MKYLATLLALLFLLLACNSKPKADAAKRYVLRGEVIKVDAQAKVATIKHEKIDGWMDAMTMDFPVKQQADLEKMKPGVRITAAVVVEDIDYHLEDVKVE